MSNRKKPKNKRLIRDRALGRLEAQQFEIPSEEKVLLKEVPAKVDGVVIGKALMYDDGSVDIIVAADAPSEAIAKFREASNAFVNNDAAYFAEE